MGGVQNYVGFAPSHLFYKNLDNAEFTTWNEKIIMLTKGYNGMFWS